MSEAADVWREEWARQQMFYRALAEEARARAGAQSTSLVSFRPVESDALAVHPKQVEEACEDAKKKGVPTEFLPDGRPVFTSSRHFRRYARAYGFRHRGY